LWCHDKIDSIAFPSHYRGVSWRNILAQEIEIDAMRADPGLRTERHVRQNSLMDEVMAMRDLARMVLYARGADHVLGVLDRALPADPAREIIESFCKLPERLPDAALVAA
jgi:hypothetical protein